MEIVVNSKNSQFHKNFKTNCSISTGTS